MRVNINEVFEQGRANNFCVYNNNCNKNILFIGACRLVSQLYYFNNLGIDSLKRNIYYIYIVDWYNRVNQIPKQVINNILKNTDIIVCENIKSYDILNTNELSEINFFKSFDINIDTKIFRLPNFELSCYSHFIINNCNIPYNHELMYDIYKQSRERLSRSLIKYECNEIDNFINKYFTSIKLFNTYNHPTKILLLFLFKNLMKRMGITLDITFFNTMYEYDILEGNDTPLFNIDITLYNFRFDAIIESTHDRLYDKSFCTNYNINTILPHEITIEWLS